jgi:hypothetical protein
MTKLEQFKEYCAKTGMPDSVSLFTMWCELVELERQVAERDALLKEKDAALKYYTASYRMKQVGYSRSSRMEEVFDGDIAEQALSKTLPAEALERALSAERQVGRHEAMLALSKMEPVAYIYPAAYGSRASLCKNNMPVGWNDEDNTPWFERKLIEQPQPPQT